MRCGERKPRFLCAQAGASARPTSAVPVGAVNFAEKPPAVGKGGSRLIVGLGKHLPVGT